jgi:serine protease DegQ
VVDGADDIEVELADGRETTARLVGSDPETDLAVLKVDVDHLPTIALGQLDRVRVGDVVLAIGDPFGVGETVTMGIIGALGRNHLGINTFENFIQTDAPLNPGNSGGALIDSHGNLLGINTAIYSRSGASLGIGFALPINTALLVLKKIIETGSVTRGWIGIEPQDLTPSIANLFNLKQTAGTIITGVLQGSPADQGGLKPGDILLKVNHEPVANSIALLNVIAQLDPGSQAAVDIVRKGKPLTLTLIIGKRPSPPKQGTVPMNPVLDVE